MGGGLGLSMTRAGFDWVLWRLDLAYGSLQDWSRFSASTLEIFFWGEGVSGPLHAWVLWRLDLAYGSLQDWSRFSAGTLEGKKWGGGGGGQSGPLHEEQALTRYSGDKIWHMGLSRTGVCFQQVPCRLFVQGGGVGVGGSPQQ